MAESDHQKTLSLAEQWSLKVKEDKTDKSETGIEETAGIGESAIAPEEIVPEKAAEIPVSNESTPAAEETTEAPGQEEAAVEEITKAPEQEETAVEETTEAPEPEETVEEDAEEKPEIKLETAPADFRFPTTNQTRHCFTRYIEYHRCIAAKGEDASECEKFAKYYRSLCPSEWVERWNEQRENGTFPGPL